MNERVDVRLGCERCARLLVPLKTDENQHTKLIVNRGVSQESEIEYISRRALQIFTKNSKKYS